MKKTRSASLLRYIFLAIVLFGTIALFYFHFFIADIVQKQLTAICQKNGCSFRGTVTKKGKLYPKIIIYDASVGSNNADWRWQSSSIECSFSLFRLFTYWHIPISVTCQDFQAFSCLDNQNNLAIFDCLNILADTPEQFFKPHLQFMYAQNATIQIIPQESNVQLAMQYHCRVTAQENNTMEIIATIIDGGVKETKNVTTLFSSISGIMQCIRTKEENKLSIQVKAMLADSQEALYVKGIYENESGRFSVSTNYSNCFFDPIIYTRHTSKISGQLSLSFLQKIFQQPEYLNGTVGINLTLDHAKNNTLKGQIVLENCFWNAKRICSSAKIIVSSKESLLQGPITIKTAFGDFSGNYSYDLFAKIGACTIKNKQEGKAILFPFIALQNKSFDFNCHIYKQYCTMQLTSDIIDTLKHKTYKNNLTAMISYDEGLHLRGNIDTIALTGYVLWKKKYQANIALYNVKKELACITIQQEDNKKYRFSGYTQTTLIKTIAEFFIESIPAYGSGILHFNGTKDSNVVTTNYTATGGAIDIPSIHNFILDTHGTIAVDTQRKKITIPAMYMQFSTGSMFCNNAELLYDDTWAVETCEIPFTIDKCAVSPHNFFDSLISAKTQILKKTNRDPLLIISTVKLHHGFIKNDEPFKKLFSEQRFLPFNSAALIEHAIDFETENPIRIATKQIKTDIMVKITSNGQINTPRLHGYITCHNGEILFPYKSLHITHGKVIFSGGDFQDATVELFARNIVKNYKISMRATGSIVEHSIFFDAAPPISQTQISSLLFFGSLQENVSIFMPSLFSHTIKLGSLDIHFVPGFVDKSSRGGIRGALEIAVNNRLRATIQKNFTLSEDTRFELEYAITDNVSLRAVRDERRDLGGELELRWKF